MELVTSYDFFIEAMNFSKSFRKKNCTNYYYDSVKSRSLILNEKLFFVKINEVIFVFKRNKEFLNVYFYASDSNQLYYSLYILLQTYPDLIFIFDIVSRSTESDVLMAFKKSNFNIYTSLVRMNRISEGYSLNEFINDQYLKVAEVAESIEVFNLLNTYFDPMAEQLPTRDEIIDYSNNGNILVYKYDNKVVGFVIYQLVGLTLYLRYWFVAPEYREMKIGSKLFYFFLFNGKGSKRQLFWVIQTNQNAIIRYEHYGFNKEKMFNFVLINKKLKYEG
jgi:ribosomal protein S18 acetylase RimI-like enzyme